MARNLFLPGIFLVPDEYIARGYDLVLGKPWMIRIEHYFVRTKFELPSSKIPAKQIYSQIQTQMMILFISICLSYQ